MISSKLNCTVIDPLHVTDFARTQDDLEHFWIFCIAVAGKNADQTAGKVAKLLARKRPTQTPREYLKSLGPLLRDALVECRTGQYDRIGRAIAESFDIDLRTAAVGLLEQIHGVGPKTARFFVLHTRADARVAVLDTHLLKWLKRKKIKNVPPHTPGSLKRYCELEARAIAMMERAFPEMTLAEADLHLWATLSGRVSEDS